MKSVKEKNGPNYFIAIQISDEGIIENINKVSLEFNWRDL